MIAVSILASFPPEMFDSIGLVKSLWQVRLANVTTDVEGLLEEILRVKEPQVPQWRWEERGGQLGRQLGDDQLPG